MKASSGAVFVQTNDAASNSVAAFARDADGRLAALGSFPTGGRGNGNPHLPSQGSLALAADGTRLLVTNAGSDDVSVLAVAEDGLVLLARAASGGRVPTSIAVNGDLVYVLNTGGMEPGGLSGFRLSPDGELTPIEGSARPLSSAEADGAQVGFSPDGGTVVVTERVTDRLSSYAVRPDGLLDGPAVHESAGITPYGFDFAANGVLVVTEAFGGQVGAAAASSYVLDGKPALALVSASVRNTRSEVCWAAVSRDDRYAYVTNFGDGTISSYTIGDDGRIELLEPAAASTRLGEKGIRDEALTGDGRFLYALDADSQQVFGWQVEADGSLSAVGAIDGLPATVAGLAAL